MEQARACTHNYPSSSSPLSRQHAPPLTTAQSDAAACCHVGASVSRTQSADEICMVMEACLGGDLLDGVVHAATEGGYTQLQAAWLVRQMVQAVRCVIVVVVVAAAAVVVVVTVTNESPSLLAGCQRKEPSSS